MNGPLSNTRQNVLPDVSREPAEAALDLTKSTELYAQAQRVLPGGTTRVTVKRTPVPVYVARGEGAYLIDEDGNRYLDCIGNYTACIHGHAFPPVVSALQAQLGQGTCFANPTMSEIGLAGLLVERVPSIDRIRFANSGTEAVMFAVKGARAFTGRSGIAKMEGAYHGAYDWVEVSEASTPQNWGGTEPNSTAFYHGVPASVLQETVVLPLNDTDTTVALIEKNATNLACVIVDLMPSRAGLIKLTADYLSALREVTARHGIVLISDEVLNFRHGYNGISAAHDFVPDMITLGKIVGGGLPVGAFGGREEIMAVYDSSNGAPRMPHGGTFTANPLSMVAGKVAMDHMDKDMFVHINRLGERVRSGIRHLVGDLDLPISVTGDGSVFRYHLREQAPTTSRQAWVPPKATVIHKRISMELLNRGVMMPSDTSGCLSSVMTDGDIDMLLEAFRETLLDMPELAAGIADTIRERPE